MDKCGIAKESMIPLMVPKKGEREWSETVYSFRRMLTNKYRGYQGMWKSVFLTLHCNKRFSKVYATFKE